MIRNQNKQILPHKILMKPWPSPPSVLECFFNHVTEVIANIIAFKAIIFWSLFEIYMLISVYVINWEDFFPLLFFLVTQSSNYINSFWIKSLCVKPYFSMILTFSWPATQLACRTASRLLSRSPVSAPPINMNRIVAAYDCNAISDTKYYISSTSKNRKSI